MGYGYRALVALVAIDRDIPRGLDHFEGGEYLSRADNILGDFCCVDESAYEYIKRDIWECYLYDVPDYIRPYVNESAYAEDLSNDFDEIDIPGSSLVAIFSN